jgi:hypothetical protein
LLTKDLLENFNLPLHNWFYAMAKYNLVPEKVEPETASPPIEQLAKKEPHPLGWGLVSGLSTSPP